MMTRPLRSLRLVLPYRRRKRDRLLERLLQTATPLLVRILPRNTLARDQLRHIGLPAPSTLEQDLTRNALREILRLITGGWKRLDLGPLDSADITDWKEPAPILFLSMHHGQWEWLAGILTHLHPEAMCVARAPAHPWGQRILDWLRNGIGLRMTYDHPALRLGRRQLAEGKLLAFLADQRPPGVSRSGVWMGHPTPVSALPEWWTRDLPFHLWTGTLHPGLDSYVLELKEWDSQTIHSWDVLLDQEFLPLLAQAPGDHFGLWHHRLKPRPTRHS